MKKIMSMEGDGDGDSHSSPSPRNHKPSHVIQELVESCDGGAKGKCIVRRLGDALAAGHLPGVGDPSLKVSKCEDRIHCRCDVEHGCQSGWLSLSSKTSKPE